MQKTDSLNAHESVFFQPLFNYLLLIKIISVPNCFLMD